MPSFFTAEDRAARREGVQHRIGQKRARCAKQLQAIEEVAQFLLPRVLDQIREDYRSGERKSEITFSHKEHSSLGVAGYKHVAHRLLELIRERTGLMGGDSYETEFTGHIWINLA